MNKKIILIIIVMIAVISAVLFYFYYANKNISSTLELRTQEPKIQQQENIPFDTNDNLDQALDELKTLEETRIE